MPIEILDMIDYRLDGLRDSDVIEIDVDEEVVIISVSELKTLDKNEIEYLISNPWKVLEPFVYPI